MSQTKENTDKLQQLILFFFHLLIFITPFIWTSFTSELFELPKMIFVYFITIVIAALWLIRMVIHKKVIISRTFLDIPILLFLISQTLSTLFSINTHTSLFGYYSRFHGGLFSTISYILLYYAFVSNIRKSQIKNFLITLLASATLLSLYALPEHFGHSPSCAFITGDFNVSCWVQDVQNRIFGTFGQPNWLAAYLITIIFIPAGILLKSLNRTKPYLTLKNASLFLALILFFLTLVFTKSRSGFVGFGLGSIIFVISLFLNQATPVKSTIKWLGLLLATTTILFFFFGKGSVPQLNSYLLPLKTKQVATKPTIQTGTVMEVGGTKSTQIRRIVWRGAYDIFLQYPILGSGTETFAYAYNQARLMEHNQVSEWDFLYNKAHNEFLNLLATTGIVGLATYLLFMLSFSYLLLKNIRHQADSSYLFAAFLAGFWALAVSNFIGFSTVPVALLFFLLPAITIVLTRPKTLDTPTQKELGIPQYLLITLAVLISLFFINRIYNILQADISYKAGKASLKSGEIVNAAYQLDDAIRRFPSEPNYTEQLSLATAQAALLTYQAGDASQAAELAVQSQLISDLNIRQNPMHLNYHKTRARMFIHLSQLDPEFVKYAINALDAAQVLAPTDPKITYNLALLYQQQGDSNQRLAHLLKAIDMKPNYADARNSLAKLYIEQSQTDQAIEQYQYILDHIAPNHPNVLKALESIATQSGETIQ